MDDEKIVQLYWDRDERAISATAEKYGSYCAQIARNILGDREDADECVNDAYMSAWSSMPPHRPGVLSAFLGKIVRNLSLNRYRRNTAAKRGGGEAPAVLEEIGELVSGGVAVHYYRYGDIRYALWEQEGFAFSYVYTGGGSAEVQELIRRMG